MEEIYQAIRNFYKKHYSGISPQWELLTEEVLNEDKERERFDLMQHYIPLQKDFKLFELGSGFGSFLLHMKKKGYDIVGVEPDAECFGVIEKRCRLEGIPNPALQSGGELLPFPTGTFDCIFSFQVIEHVADMDKIILECGRVLKKGGYLYWVVPNYASFWEPHYALLFPNFLGKKAFRLWLRFLKRDTAFLESLNFVTAKALVKKITQNGFSVLDVGKGIFTKRFRDAQMPTWGQTGYLRWVAGVCIKLKINRILASVLNALDMHYPINLTARKL